MKCQCILNNPPLEPVMIDHIFEIEPQAGDIFDTFTDRDEFTGEYVILRRKHLPREAKFAFILHCQKVKPRAEKSKIITPPSILHP